MSLNIALGLDGTDTPERIGALVARGADEFFAGYVPKRWYETHGWECSPNRRAYGPECQFLEADSLGKAIAAVHAAGKRIVLAFNAHSYSQDQVPLLRSLVEEVEALEPDAYVVADLALVLLLREWGISRPLHLSTGAACFNAAAVRHFSHLANVERVVIPRKMALSEMAMLIKALDGLDLEFEAMVLGYRCFFNDEFCFSLHSAACENFCSRFCYARCETSRRWPRTWKSTLETVAENVGDQFKRNSVLDAFIRETSCPPGNAGERHRPTRGCGDTAGMTSAVADLLLQNCGLCSIPRLREIGVNVLKIPTRGSPWLKERHLDLLRAVVDHPASTPEACRALVDSPDFCSDLGHCYYAREKNPVHAPV